MKYDISKTIVPILFPILGAHVMCILCIYIAKSWLFRNKWCIFAKKHKQNTKALNTLHN